MRFMWMNLLLLFRFFLFVENYSSPSYVSSHFKAVCGDGVALPSAEAAGTFCKVTFFRCVAACLQQSFCTGFTFVRNAQSADIKRTEGQCEILHMQTNLACGQLPARPGSRYMVGVKGLFHTA